MANKKENPDNGNNKPERRASLSQNDIPSYSLDRSLTVAQAIGENFAYRPTTPLNVASALGVIPTTGAFRMLTGAALAYGLTTGSYSANEIGISDLGLRIVRPVSDEADVDQAKREAVLKPKILGDFLRRYDNAALPKQEIGHNVLLTMGVPADRCKDALEMILENAKSVGFLRQINDKTFVDLKAASSNRPTIPSRPSAAPSAPEAEDISHPAEVNLPLQPREPQDDSRLLRARRVFITHGKNRALIEPIKKLLTFGDLEAVVSVHSQTVSLPVPGKIMEEMRSCGAAIIHVEGERQVKNEDDTIQSILNDNVLIEIGAAMALFGARFILVVKDGVELPSNLQGLLELRYKGATLDVNDTVSLLDAIADMKRRPLPI